MSLTAIMKDGFTDALVRNIPIPHERFNPIFKQVFFSKTRNFSVQGTAFDYLLRSELKRLHPSAKEESLIAENFLDRIESNSIEEIKCVNATVTKKQINDMNNVMKKYKKEKTLFLQSGTLTNSFIELTIRIARIDPIFRASYYDDVSKPVEQKDIEDMRALYELVPNEIRQLSDPLILDATFGEFSVKVKGADIDLISKDSLIDIKTTKDMKLNKDNWSQIVGYLILADCYHEQNKKFPKFEKIGFYFSRYGTLWTTDANYVRDNPNYRDMQQLLLNWYDE